MIFALDRRSFALGLSALAVASAAKAEPPSPEILVTKDPSCGCCNAWVEHFRQAGFEVRVVEAPVNPLKAKLGVPRDLASCHTAQVGGYVVEGHVPALIVKRLLDRRPRIAGIAVAGMPVGSPGMEVEGVDPDTYEVVAFGPAGRSTFARFRGGTEL